APVDAVREGALVADPEVHVGLARAHVGIVDVEGFRAVAIRDDRIADDDGVLVAVAAADVDACERAVVEVVVQDAAVAPLRELRHGTAFEGVPEREAGDRLAAVLGADGLAGTVAAAPEADVAHRALKQLPAIVDPVLVSLSEVGAGGL